MEWICGTNANQRQSIWRSLVFAGPLAKAGSELFARRTGRCLARSYGSWQNFVFEKLIESGWKGKAVYTVPTRALANDKFRDWRDRGWGVGLVTGDLRHNPEARVVVATLETQRGTRSREPCLICWWWTNTNSGRFKARSGLRGDFGHGSKLGSAPAYEWKRGEP